MNKMIWTVALGALVVGCSTTVGTAATTEKKLKPKVLYVMLDGNRADALVNAVTPNIDKLRNGTWQPGYNGVYSDFGLNVPDARPSSAANHTAIATGVNGAKSRVFNNGQTKSAKWKEWPTWLARVADTTGAKALYIFSWGENKDTGRHPKVQFIHGSDAANGANLPKILAAPDAPDATLYFIDLPDHGGHGQGFYPHSSRYLNHITLSDRYIGACMDAIASRPTFKDEDWLICITADHGGQSRTHGLWGGHCTTIPLVMATRHLPNGRLPGAPRHYDLTATALTHFGLDVSKMNLDAKPLTAVAPAAAPRKLTDGLAAYLPCDDKTLANTVKNAVTVKPLGSRAAYRAGGQFEGCVSFTGEKVAAGGLCLAGSEKLAFENGANFTVTLWARLPQDQEGDALIFGNKDWNKGINPGLGLVSAKATDGVRVPGVAMNAVPGDGRPRIDMGAFDIEYGKWTFYAVTYTKEGVMVVCQGTSDGRFYWVVDRAPALKFKTGLPFHIGQDGTGNYCNTLRGDVDDFALWTRSLSLEEIRAIYEQGRKGLALGDLIK